MATRCIRCGEGITQAPPIRIRICIECRNAKLRKEEQDVKAKWLILRARYDRFKEEK